MKHIKRFNEENIFNKIFNKKTSCYKIISKLSNEFKLPFKRIDKKNGTNNEYFILGPKNGHEINITFKKDQYGDEVTLKHNTADIIIVRPSYYGAFYELEKEVDDLEEYLLNYNFKYIPNIKHKYSR